MNIQRFVLPGTVAAAFHAVLLYAFTDVRPPMMKLRAGPVEKTTIEQTVELFEPPTVADPDPDPAVRPLAKGTPYEEAPDIVVDQPRALPMPVEEQQTKKIKIDSKGPWGDPNGIESAIFAHRPPSFTPVALLDKPPQAKVQMPPEYPATMRHDNIAGVVTVEFDVDVKGRVVSARVRESTHHAFEEPTLRAVLTWRFEPGLSQGRPVPFRMVIPVDFKLGAS